MKGIVAGAGMCMEIGHNRRTKGTSLQVHRLVRGCGKKSEKPVRSGYGPP